MSAVLADASVAALVAAIENNPVEYWRTCCDYLPDAEFHDEQELTWFATNIAAAPWFNQVMLARFAREQVDARIDETLALFEARSVPMLWSVTPSASPPDLGRHLAAHGLSLSSTMAGMAVDLGALSEESSIPPGFTVERAADVGMLEQWAEAYINGFEMEEPAGRGMYERYLHIGFADEVPFRHYVGLLRGEPAASSTLFLGAGVAGIFHVGTVPAARRQGIGAAMTLAPLREAATMGYRVGVLYASAMGTNVYRRLGFREYFTVTQYQWQHREGL